MKIIPIVLNLGDRVYVRNIGSKYFTRYGRVTRIEDGFYQVILEALPRDVVWFPKTGYLIKVDEVKTAEDPNKKRFRLINGDKM